MRKFLRRGLLGIVASLLAMLGGVWLLGLKRHADAAPEALGALRSGDDVVVSQGRYLVLRPKQQLERMGLILYPGAYVDIRGYVPTLRPIAAAGYRVVIVPMPLDVAIFGIDRALDVQEANPDIKRWVLLGHSLGGAMAGVFASRHREALDGLVIWDSYPATSLVDYGRPVWHIHRATPDGKPPPAFVAKRALFPPNSTWIPIPGGVHMYFGAFSGGGYREDWAPTISREEEHRQVIAATLRALQSIEGSRTSARPVAANWGVVR